MARERIRKIVDSRIFWAVISVLAAICLWAYVISLETEDSELTLRNLTVDFTGVDVLRESKGLIISEVSADEVQLTFRGSRRVLNRINERNIHVYIDATALEVGRYSQPVQVELPDGVNTGDVTVTTRKPQYISFQVEKLGSKVVDIQTSFTGSVAEGFVGSELVTSPESLEIYGAQESLDQVDHALVVVERDNVASSIHYDSNYSLIDVNGKEIDMEKAGLSANMNTVRVSMEIKVIKDVPLAIDLLDGGGALQENASVTITPEEIRLSGDAQQMESINRVTLGSIDLSQVDGSYEHSYTIVLDNGLTNESGVTEAKVTVEIRGLEKKKMTVSNISLTGLEKGRKAELITTSLEVTLRAKAALLEQIQEENLRAVADLSGVTEASGQVEVPVHIYVDGFESAGAVGNYTALVQIQR